MSTSEIKERAQAVFREVFEHPDLQISSEMTAQDVEGWDSLAHIKLILALQKEFKLKLKAADVVGIKNIGELLDLIQNKT